MAIKKQVDVAAGTVAFDFGNGRTFVAAVDSLPDYIKRELMLHGASQKLGDSYSGALRAVQDGEAETVEEYAEACVSGVYENLTAGQWNSTRTGTGGSARIPMVVEAISRVQQISLEAALAAYERLDEEQAKQLARFQAIKDAMAVIKAERAAARAEAAKNRPADTAGLAALLGG